MRIPKMLRLQQIFFLVIPQLLIHCLSLHTVTDRSIFQFVLSNSKSKIHHSQWKTFMTPSQTSSPEQINPKSHIATEFEYITLEYRNKEYKQHSALGTTVENSPALVLNADYSPLSFMPLSLWDWQDTLRAVFSGRANIISTYNNLFVRSVSQVYPVPSVIALTQYHKMPCDKAPALSRRNVYLRDGFRCQYCMEKMPVERLSLDHVVPRAKGGKLTWTNTVSACCQCNFKKGKTMPEDLTRIGMRLRSVPREPTYHELQAKVSQ